MIVKKFTAATTREALLQVREALGPEALILSNRIQDGRVEIMAMAESNMAALTGRALPATPPAAASLLTPLPLSPEIPALQMLDTPQPAAPACTTEATAPPSTPQSVADLTVEMKNIRSLIESQLVKLAWG